MTIFIISFFSDTISQIKSEFSELEWHVNIYFVDPKSFFKANTFFNLSPCSCTMVNDTLLTIGKNWLSVH